MIRLGTQVNGHLYANGIGYVVAVNEMPSGGNVVPIGSRYNVANDCTVDVVFIKGNRSNDIPECIVRGAQWDINEHVIAKPAMIEKLIAHNEKYLAEQNRKAEAEAAVFEASKADCKDNYPWLTPITDRFDYKQKAKNVRAMLKHQFPKTKFSVRKHDTSSIYIYWTDGPTTIDVKNVIEYFLAGHYNGMEDIFEHDSTPFNSVFGGFDSINYERSWSEELYNAKAEELSEHFNEPAPTYEQFKNGEANNISPISNWDGQFFWSWRGIATRYLEGKEL